MIFTTEQKSQIHSEEKVYNIHVSGKAFLFHQIVYLISGSQMNMKIAELKFCSRAGLRLRQSTYFVIKLYKWVV